MNSKAVSMLASVLIVVMATVAVADISFPNRKFTPSPPPGPPPELPAKIKVVFTQGDKAELIVPKGLRGQLNPAAVGAKTGAVPQSAPVGNAPNPAGATPKTTRFSAPIGTVVGGAAISLAAILAGLVLLKHRMPQKTRLVVGMASSVVVFAFVAFCVSQSNANVPPPESRRRPEPPIPQAIQFGTFDLNVKYVDKGDVIELRLPLKTAPGNPRGQGNSRGVDNPSGINF
jgi:hypothetical protein